MGALAIAAIMLVAGLMKTINLLILLGDLLIVLVMMNAYIAWRTVRLLNVIPNKARDPYLGQVSTRTVSIENGSQMFSSCLFTERSTFHTTNVFAPAIPPKCRCSLRYTFKPKQRGEHVLSRSVQSGYPFGFVTCERAGLASETVTVLPELGSIDLDRFRRWLIRSGGGDGRTRQPHARQLPYQANVRGVRSFRRGDSPRLIHWRSTARRNELLVREFDSPESLDLVMVVETWLPINASEKQKQFLEETVTLAATLLNAWCLDDQSRRMSLVLASREPIEGFASPQLARQLLRSLATVQGVPTFDLKARALRIKTSRMIRLLVSSRPKEGPLPELLHEYGTWQRITPLKPPAWYHPPS